MSRILQCCLMVGFVGWGAALDPSAGVGLDASLRDALRIRLESPDGAFVAAGETIYAQTALPAFYERRLYEPIWGSEPMAAGLIAALTQSLEHGLRPDDYHLHAIESLRAAALVGETEPGVQVDLELLLTDAFLIYGAHLVSGRIDPASFDPEWVAVRREVDLVAQLERAVELGNPRPPLDELAPTHPHYRLLQEALARYRAMTAWSSIPDTGKKIEDGDPRLPLLLERLRASGDLAEGSSSWEEAVKAFQRRHGLGDDGVVGAKTLRELNEPLSARIRALELNLERWRWLPRDLGRRYVLVDIPAYVIKVVDDGAPIFESRVVVGRSYRRTPVMSDTIRYLVLNPFWEVPHKLAVQDKLPEIRRDPTYFERNGFQVFRGWGSEEQAVDPATVDWQSVTAKSFPFRLRQAPGPLNALGRIKIMFPNPFNVYVHDTPSRELFSKPERAASSGCIRVEKPLELAVKLLEPGWSLNTLEGALGTGETRTVSIPVPWPIHLQYWTAAIDEQGRTVFRPDIYERDRALAAALNLPPPGDDL